MSLSKQAGIIQPGYDPLRVANAPTIGTATAGNAQATVSFTAPACVGGGAISSYTVFSNCGTKTATGASSPLTVTGLTNGTSYTFKVVATNAYGQSYPSAASNSASPTNAGQQAYTTPGTYSWVAPACITSVSVVVVGGGGGANSTYGNSGAGGGLAYKNNISVTPGSSYSVVVAAGGAGGLPNSGFGTPGCPGGSSSFTASFGTVTATGGSNPPNNYNPQSTTRGAPAGNYDGGGTGGYGGSTGANSGGGGAGGYSGNGGNGRETTCSSSATAGAGGGGGGGGNRGGGGGVGLLGQGCNGAAGSNTAGTGTTGGRGGSGGCNGQNAYAGSLGTPRGGNYGGGGGYSGGTYCGGGSGAGGAVRIIWPGTTRQFPSTNTGNL